MLSKYSKRKKFDKIIKQIKTKLLDKIKNCLKEFEIERLKKVQRDRDWKIILWREGTVHIEKKKEEIKNNKNLTKKGAKWHPAIQHPFKI